jgi:hypothetical protein
MRLEIIIFGITAFLALNHYYDGKYMKMIYSWKKYYQVAGILLGGFVIYWILKKSPAKHRNRLLASTSEYMKYVPLDSSTSSILNPILDFTSKQTWGSTGGGAGMGERKVLPMGSSREETRILNSGGGGLNSTNKATKRSVSESKKKWVAAYQNWKCGGCQKQLPAWFEIDHRIRLEHGGSNHVDNLVALCRDCHGKKTMIENL